MSITSLIFIVQNYALNHRCEILLKLSAVYLAIIAEDEVNIG